MTTEGRGWLVRKVERGSLSTIVGSFDEFPDAADDARYRVRKDGGKYGVVAEEFPDDCTEWFDEKRIEEESRRRKESRERKGLAGRTTADEPIPDDGEEPTNESLGWLSDAELESLHERLPALPDWATKAVRALVDEVLARRDGEG